MSRRDDVGELYKPSKRLELIAKTCFIIDVFAGFLSLVSHSSIASGAVCIQIIIAFIYVMVVMVDDGFFLFMAEKERRRNGIQDGYGIRLSEFNTESYYNNTLPPSIEKYGLNLLESNYFSKYIAGKMILKSGLMTGVAIIILFIACRFVEDSNVLLIISQTVFSSYVMLDFVMLLIYKLRLDNLYEEAYNSMILGNHNERYEAWIISYIVEYESIKSYYKVRLDEKIFDKYNSKLSRKWDKIVEHRNNN